MRTAYRVLSTAVAAGAIFPFGMPTAAASTKLEVTVETAAWFWSAQTSGAGPGGVPYPALNPRASGVPEGNLAVAYKGESKTDADGNRVAVPEKETYLMWDVYDVPEGSTVEQFTFTMVLNEDSHQVYAPAVDIPGQGRKGGAPAIVACAATIGFGEADGDAFTAKPDDNCADQVFGEYDDTTKSYTFHAPTYAQDWVDGLDNYGLGIRPLEDATEPFELHFLPAAMIKTTIVYTPPVAEPTAAPTSFEPIPVPTVPSTDTDVFVPDVQPQPEPEPQPVPTPEVVKPRPQVVVQPVAATPFSRDGALSPLFWFAMIGGVLLLGVTSLILGDPLVPEGGSTTRVRTTGRHRLAPAPARATRPIRPRTV